METMKVSSPAEGVETLASASDRTEMEDVSEGETMMLVSSARDVETSSAEVVETVASGRE